MRDGGEFDTFDDIPNLQCNGLKNEDKWESVDAKQEVYDNVNKPKHYNSSPAKCSSCGKQIECIDVTKHMSFTIGNCLKYCWRSDLKNGLEDLKKARWYLDCEIKKLEDKNV